MVIRGVSEHSGAVAVEEELWRIIHLGRMLREVTGRRAPLGGPACSCCMHSSQEPSLPGSHSYAAKPPLAPWRTHRALALWIEGEGWWFCAG